MNSLKLDSHLMIEMRGIY